jgi:hypothetical protein
VLARNAPPAVQLGRRKGPVVYAAQECDAAVDVGGWMQGAGVCCMCGVGCWMQGAGVCCMCGVGCWMQGAGVCLFAPATVAPHPVASTSRAAAHLAVVTSIASAPPTWK